MLRDQNRDRWRRIIHTLTRPAGRRTAGIATLALLTFVVCVAHRDAVDVARGVRGYFQARARVREMLALRQFRSQLGQAAEGGMDLPEFRASFGALRPYEGAARCADGSVYTHVCTHPPTGRRFRLRFEDGRLMAWNGAWSKGL